jgi:hypothetical protein
LLFDRRDGLLQAQERRRRSLDVYVEPARPQMDASCFSAFPILYASVRAVYLQKEHSSFSELEYFVRNLSIRRIIPTVNVGSEKNRREMESHFRQWQQGT